MTDPRDLEMAILAYNLYLPSGENELPTGSWQELTALSVEDDGIGFGCKKPRTGIGSLGRRNGAVRVVGRLDPLP